MDSISRETAPQPAQIPNMISQAASAPAGVPLFDAQRQYGPLEGQVLAALARVCASGRYVLGPDCEQLERAMAEYCQAKHGIACASGSDALLLALMACDVGPGDEVIVPSYTFFATASVVARLGAKPVFVDIEPRHFNLDPRLVEAAVTPATKVIVPVHLYGQCADMTPLLQLAQRHGLAVIEDAAQAIGAEYGGRRAGSLGHIGCFSFYPTKNLGAFGDAGMLTTQSDQLAEKLRLLRVHGMQPRYHHQVIGINSRLDSIQAAILNVKLPHLEHWTTLRQSRAALYAERFAGYGLDRVLGLPAVAEGRRHVWNQYVVRVPGGRRDALRTHLAERKIATEIYYPIPLHEQPCFAYLGCPKDSLPETQRAAAETLALPIFPELTGAEQALVAREIAAFFGVRTPDGHALKGPKYRQLNQAAGDEQ